MNSRDRGVALASTLVIVSVAALVAVVGVQNSRFSESVAGANRASSAALMAAELGVAEAMGLIDVNNRVVDGVGTIEGAQFDGLVYEYATEDLGGSLIRVVAGGRAGQGIERALEVQVELVVLGADVDFGELSPLNFPGDVDGFQAPNSDSFLVEGVVEDSVDGGARPAIAVNSQEQADYIFGEIQGVGRENNYTGGIEPVLAGGDDGGGSILSNPDKFSEFLGMLKAFAASDSSGQIVSNVVTDGNPSSRTNLGTVDSPMITFVEGDFSAKGNVYGAGILVVEGNYGISGTPQFEGLVIVLGTTFGITGGGQGGLNGALVLAPMETVLDDDGVESVVYSEANVVTSGGGNANYSYSAERLNMAFNMMPESLRDFWNENNDSLYQDGGVEMIVHSWRESY